MRRALALISVFALAGCNSGIGYVAANYGVETGEPIHTKDGDFKIWDHQSDGKMLVSPTVAEVFAHPLPQNLGIAVEGGPEAAAARAAANSWFQTHQRNCKILTVAEVARPEFEIKYSCQ